MPTITGSIEAEQRRYKEKARIKTGFTFVVDNQTDDDITDSFFGVEYKNGGDDFITGFKVPARSVWQHSIDVTRCVKIVVATVWFGDDDMMELEKYPDAGAGYCWNGAGWKIFYGAKDLRMTSQLGIARTGDATGVALAVADAWVMKPDGESFKGCTEPSAADVSMRGIGG